VRKRTGLTTLASGDILPNMKFRYAIILIATTIFGICADKAPPGPKPLNEVATAGAWDALNKEKFDEAIKAADKCIEEFLPAAKRIEEELEKKKESTPNGVVNESEKAKVFANGLLNDVGTCLFIKGRSLEKLNKKDAAKAAYVLTKSLKHARSWDPAGWFWSPAEAAADRLALL